MHDETPRDVIDHLECIFAGEATVQRGVCDIPDAPRRQHSLRFIWQQVRTTTTKTVEAMHERLAQVPGVLTLEGLEI